MHPTERRQNKNNLNILYQINKKMTSIIAIFFQNSTTHGFALQNLFYKIQ